jgi:hypothetical protein
VEAVKSLHDLARTTPHSLDEWTAAAMYLGDGYEALLPSVEAMSHATGWKPLTVVQSADFWQRPE